MVSGYSDHDPMTAGRLSMFRIANGGGPVMPAGHRVQSAGGSGASTSRLPLSAAETTPASSMVSIMRAARL